MYGWWVGELNSLIGIVPKEYLTTAFEQKKDEAQVSALLPVHVLAMPLFLCEGGELPVKQLFLISEGEANNSPLKDDDSGIVFPKLGE